MEGCDGNLSGKDEVQKFRFQTPAPRFSHDVAIANKEEKKGESKCSVWCYACVMASGGN